MADGKEKNLTAYFTFSNLIMKWAYFKVLDGIPFNTRNTGYTLYVIIPALGSRGPVVKNSMILSMLSLFPFIFQLPPTKNLRTIFAENKTNGLYLQNKWKLMHYKSNYNEFKQNFNIYLCLIIQNVQWWLMNSQGKEKKGLAIYYSIYVNETELRPSNLNIIL